MEDEYDVIVLGTGLKECLLSGLLSVGGKKVLHMDRNDYYGASEASLNMGQLHTHCQPEEKWDSDKLKKENDNLKKKYGNLKEYSVDLCPKFIMANGNMVKMLLKTKVTRYLDFKCIDGSFVMISKDKPIEVPVTPGAALKSSLLTIWQKRRYRNFLMWVLATDFNDPKSWDKLDLKMEKGVCKTTVKEVVEYWKLSDDTIAFSGHAVALYTNDQYLTNPKETWPFLDRMKLYAHSLARYDKSPYIYPVWGLGGLPEGFSRLAAVHGGVYMLRRSIKKINYDEDGKVVSVETENNGTAKLKKGGQVLGDPTYFVGSNKIKQRDHSIARWIHIVKSSEVKEIVGKEQDSAQIIIAGQKSKRKHDIYVSVGGNDLKVAPRGYSIVTICSIVVSKTEKEQKAELNEAKKLITSSIGDFFICTPCYFACNDPRKDNTFITTTMDATTHFQSATTEVMTIYRLMTGSPVDLSANLDDIDKDE